MHKSIKKTIIFLTVLTLFVVSFGVYKNYVDALPLSLDIFVDKDNDMIPDYAEKGYLELETKISELQIPDEEKEHLKLILLRGVGSIINIYTSQEKSVIINAEVVIRCIFKEINFIKLKYKIKSSDLLSIKSSWDTIQFPKGSSKTYLTKRISKLGLRIDSSNAKCFKNSISREVRIEEKINRGEIKVSPFFLLRRSLRVF